MSVRPLLCVLWCVSWAVACRRDGKPDDSDTEQHEGDADTEVDADTDADVDSDAPHTDPDAPDTDSDAPDTDSDAPDTDSDAPDTDSDASDTDSDAPDTDTDAPHSDTGGPDSEDSDLDSESELPAESGALPPETGLGGDTSLLETADSEGPDDSDSPATETASPETAAPPTDTAAPDSSLTDPTESDSNQGGPDSDTATHDTATDSDTGTPVWELPPWTVYGTVHGLVGSGLEVASVTGVVTPVNESGTFAFEAVANGYYYVWIQAQPGAPTQQCTILPYWGWADHDGATTEVEIFCLHVEPYFAGTRLNEWIYDDGATPYEASGTPCDPEYDRLDDCFDAGAYLQVRLSGISDCGAVSNAKDTKSWFDWSCEETDEGPRLVSDGWPDTLALKSVLDATNVRFFANPVEVTSTKGVLSTGNAPWWSNPVSRPLTGVDAVDHSVTIADGNGHYDLSGTNGALLTRIAGGGVSGNGVDPVVDLTDATFAWVEGDVYFKNEPEGIRMKGTRVSRLRNLYVKQMFGGTGGSNVSLEDAERNVIEVSKMGLAYHAGIDLAAGARENEVRDVDFDPNRYGTALRFRDGAEANHVHDVFVENGATALPLVHVTGGATGNRLERYEVTDGGRGVLIDDAAEENWLVDGRIHDISTWDALEIDSAHGNRVVGLWVADVANSRAVQIREAQGNVLDQVFAYGIGHYWEDPEEGMSSARVEAIRLDRASNNVLSRLVLPSVYTGVSFYLSPNNVLQHVTVLASGEFNSPGIETYDGTTVHNAAVVLGTDGIMVWGPYNQLFDLAVTDMGQYGIALHSLATASVLGTLTVGNNRYQDCVDQIPGAWVMGCTVGDFASHDDLLTGVSAASSFVGLVDDVTNASAVDGEAEHDSISDWVGFDTPTRGWGQEPFELVQFDFADGAWPSELENDPDHPWSVVSRTDSQVVWDDPYAIFLKLTEPAESCVTMSGTFYDGLVRFSYLNGNHPASNADRLVVRVDGVETLLTVGSSTWKVFSDNYPATSEIQMCLRKGSDSSWTTQVWIESLGVMPWPHCDRFETCSVLDAALRADDSMLREAHPLPDGDRVIVHGWGACSDPAVLNAYDCENGGDTWDYAATETTFLARAAEILDDGIGDDDALCESGETCVYTPNFGGYQGHGSLTGAGAFADGALTGITLQKHVENGY